MLKELLTHPMFLSVLISWFIVQTIKVFIFSYRAKKLLPVYYIDGSGMPSGHSATITAVLFSAYLETGISSLTIALLFVAIIIMRDQIGACIVGQQSVHLNEVMKKLKINKKLREDIGHDIQSVIVGLLIALVVSVAVHKII